MRRWLLAAAVLLAGCGGDGGRTDEDRIDDHAIEADVNRALSRVPGVDRLRVRVECLDGRVVLSGSVADGAAAKAACDAAGKVDGVKGVADQLKREK
ncbi:MAG: BON domain-containing protein [Planctomycetes bacterium]|nr:BON domain-containing protein [Planctomycetota bacterium]